MTGYPSKKKAAQDKVTDIDGHVVRDVRKPKKVAALDRDAEIERLNEKIEFLARTNMLYSDWEHRNTQVTSDLMRKGIEAAKLNADLRAEIAKLKAQLAPQPAQKPNWAWTCNECGAQEFTAALSEADLDYLACSNCGGDEFHKEALAQPALEPVAWMYPDALCDRACLYVCTKAFTQFPECATAPPQRPWLEPTGNEWFEWWRVSNVAHETEAEIDFADFLIIAQAVVAKLKEKNT